MVEIRSIEEDIIQIIAEELDVLKSAVVPDANILDHLAGDSLDTVSLILALEEKFHIDIPDAQAVSLRTVKDFFDVVRSKYSPHHCRVRCIGPIKRSATMANIGWGFGGAT